MHWSENMHFWFVCGYISHDKNWIAWVYASMPPICFLACHSPVEHSSGPYLSFWTHQGDSQNLWLMTNLPSSQLARLFLNCFFISSIITITTIHYMHIMFSLPLSSPAFVFPLPPFLCPFLPPVLLPSFLVSFLCFDVCMLFRTQEVAPVIAVAS